MKGRVTMLIKEPGREVLVCVREEAERERNDRPMKILCAREAELVRPRSGRLASRVLFLPPSSKSK
jgi:hypothetical protein